MRIDYLDPNIGEKLHETKTGTQFFKIKGTKGEKWTEDCYKATVNHCFTHMGEKGINTDGKREVVAMLNECKQLHNLDVFGPQDKAIMSFQEKYRSLRDVNLIKENRCSKTKGRTCTYGSRQCTYSYEKKRNLQPSH